eukprot:CAMPEP_0183377372 /NCGR_PEP_ID=MMETSP0164_2-20130417/122826_1 /TAXON_ID=221442 /ORGANISM="Coccolithus pelagicus ssp braarudi, Strain PLY182g" /LENGTH=232 /DNA_ID=CAMNT_0025554817 /DNA_START=134 /DNA_END=828 /DNA_ORIENTATION=+
MRLCHLLPATLLAGSEAHGRLTVPTTRLGYPDRYENSPSSRTARDAAWVCRHASPNPDVAKPVWAAGSSQAIKWVNSALHVGDCALYLSYDVDKSRTDAQFFKIANWPDCKSLTGIDNYITLPDWLPAGDAIVRWDWYALHSSPPEFFNQCADVTITANANAIAKSQISPRFSIIDPPVYPSHDSGEDSATGYRRVWADSSGPPPELGQPGWFMTGPACANGFSLNDCDLTA